MFGLRVSILTIGFLFFSLSFVIGDIHGNLEDLLTLENHLWPSLPVGPNLLFLGDYVDRGAWSVECALYVLALKVLFPHKVMFKAQITDH